jgi:hypothetical protein
MQPHHISSVNNNLRFDISAPPHIFFSRDRETLHILEKSLSFNTEMDGHDEVEWDLDLQTARTRPALLCLMASL